MYLAYSTSLLVLLTLSSGCASRRLLALENTALHQQVAALEKSAAALRERAREPADFAPRVNEGVLRGFLDRASLGYTVDGGALRLQREGQNKRFDLYLRYYDDARMLSLTVENYLALEEAQGTAGLVLLLIAVATLNFDHLASKFQIEAETGKILVSTELNVTDGLGYATFLGALDRLVRVADQRYPELKRAAEGLGS
jgi:hypothetical protein